MTTADTNEPRYLDTLTPAMMLEPGYDPADWEDDGTCKYGNPVWCPHCLTAPHGVFIGQNELVVCHDHKLVLTSGNVASAWRYLGLETFIENMKSLEGYLDGDIIYDANYVAGGCAYLEKRYATQADVDAYWRKEDARRIAYDEAICEGRPIDSGSPDENFLTEEGWETTS